MEGEREGGGLAGVYIHTYREKDQEKEVLDPFLSPPLSSIYIHSGCREAHRQTRDRASRKQSSTPFFIYPLSNVRIIQKESERDIYI